MLHNFRNAIQIKVIPINAVGRIAVYTLSLFFVLLICSNRSFSIDSQIETAEAIQAQEEIDILNLPGVVGIGIALDQVIDEVGQVADEVVFLVLVDENSPIPVLPSGLGGIRVAVKKSPQIFAHNGGEGCDPCHGQQQSLPVQMGGSTSTEWGCFAGTLGFVACDPITRRRGYVSNNHVAAATGLNLCENGAPGLMGLHTASLDATPICLGNTTQIGTLEKVVPLLSPPFLNLVDAAFVASTEEQTSQTILDIGMPANTPGTPILDSCVCKSGRTSGMTCGRVNLVNATVSVGGYCAGNYLFRQLVGYTADASCPGGSCTNPPCPMSDPGDSGSPVLDTNNNIVALNFAGDNDGNGFGATAGNVLGELGLTLDLSQCEVNPFTLLPVTPGVANTNNVIQATGSTPGKNVAFIWGRGAGSFTLQNACQGLTLDINKPKLLGTDFADPTGVATFNFFMPNRANGVTLVFQAIDLETCTVSNSIQETF